MEDIREVRLRHTQHRERHLRPLHPTLDIDIHLSPAVQPEAVLDTQLAIVVVIVSPQEALHTDGMSQGKDRSLTIHLLTTLFGVDIECSRTVFYLGVQLRSADSRRRTRTRLIPCGIISKRSEIEFATRFVLLHLQTDRRLQSRICLMDESQLLSVVEHHGIHLAPFECRKHIILIRRQELIRRGAHIIR